MQTETITRKLYKASDVATILGVSKSKAYKIIKELNEEMRSLGKYTLEGRVDSKFFEHKCFFQVDEQTDENAD